MIGIYAITHIASGHRYVGQSTNIKERLTEHKRRLRLRAHPNAKLQSYWDKYGPDAFVFGVVEECAVRDLDTLEQRYIDANPGLNVSIFVGAPMRGRKMPPGFSERMSAIHKGKVVSKATRRRMSRARMGMTFSDTHKANLSRALTGGTRLGNRRPVICIDTGKKYARCMDVVAEFGGSRSKLHDHLAGRQGKFKEHIFKYDGTPKNWKPRGTRRTR